MAGGRETQVTGAGVSKPRLKSGFACCGHVGRGLVEEWQGMEGGKRAPGGEGRGCLSHEDRGSGRFSLASRLEAEEG